MKIRDSKGDRVFNVVVNSMLFIAGFIVIYPLIYVLSASFSAPVNVISGKVWLLPVEPTLLAYRQVFKNKLIVSGYLNTFFYAVAGTIISMIVTIFGAYPLSRRKMVGRGVISKMFIAATLFSGGIVPFYLVVQRLGLLHSRWAVVVPFGLNVFHIILLRTSIQSSIPEEMIESADIDGCNHFQKLFLMVLPLSGSILAVLILYNVVGHWNSYFYAMVFLKDQSQYPLQMVLRDILIMNTITPDMTVNLDEMILKQGLADVLKYALIVVSSAPLLIIYPFIQKHFVKGVMIGSMKG